MSVRLKSWCWRNAVETKDNAPKIIFRPERERAILERLAKISIGLLRANILQIFGEKSFLLLALWEVQKVAYLGKALSPICKS